MVLALFFIVNAIGFNIENATLQLTTTGTHTFKPILDMGNAVMEYVKIGSIV